MNGPLSVLILTEDSEEDAHETIVCLLKRALVFLHPGFPTNQLRFLPPTPEARKIVHANQWKARGAGSRHEFVSMMRTIATQISMPNGLAIFHPKDLARFQAWSLDRSALDELPKPKEAIPFGSKHNLRLTHSAFPAEAVYKARKSFARFVDHLRVFSVVLNFWSAIE